MSECTTCAIDALNAAFARGLDEGDIDGLIQLFTADAVYDNGRVHLDGRTELEQWFRARATGPSRTTRHMWSALHIRRSIDDEVETVSTWMCYAANEPTPTDYAKVATVADFHDVLRLIDGVWKIHRRVIQVIFRDPSLAPPSVG